MARVPAPGTAAHPTPLALAAGTGPDAILSTGIELGANIAGVVSSTLAPRLVPGPRRAVATLLDAAGTLGAAAGLALWSVATLTGHERAARAGAAIAGVGTGLVGKGRVVGAHN